MNIRDSMRETDTTSPESPMGPAAAVKAEPLILFDVRQSFEVKITADCFRLRPSSRGGGGRGCRAPA